MRSRLLLSLKQILNQKHKKQTNQETEDQKTKKKQIEKLVKWFWYTICNLKFTDYLFLYIQLTTQCY